MDGLTDAEIRVNGRGYHVCWYQCPATGGWRCEAAIGGRVVEVIDVAHQHEALPGISKVLSRRNGHGKV